MCVGLHFQSYFFGELLGFGLLHKFMIDCHVIQKVFCLPIRGLQSLVRRRPKEEK